MPFGEAKQKTNREERKKKVHKEREGGEKREREMTD